MFSSMYVIMLIFTELQYIQYCTAEVSCSIFLDQTINLTNPAAQAD